MLSCAVVVHETIRRRRPMDPNVVTAVATTALTFFAFVQIGREWWRDRHREKAASARISARAYILRRELLLWVGEGTDRGRIAAALSGKNIGDLAQYLTPTRFALVEMMDIL